MKRYGALLVCACAVVAGCGATDHDAQTTVRTEPSVDATVFDCNGQEMRMDVLRDPVRAQVFFSGRTHEPIVLSLMQSDDSSTVYDDNGVNLVVHDDDTATLSLTDNPGSVTCTSSK